MAAVALEVAGERRSVVGRLDLAQHDVHLLGGDLALGRTERADQARLEARLELPAQREQRRLPLPVVRDTRQAAVVQLVGEVEGELEVLVGERVGRHRHVHGREGVRVAHQRGEQRLGDVTAWIGEGNTVAALPASTRRDTLSGVRALIHLATRPGARRRRDRVRPLAARAGAGRAADGAHRRGAPVRSTRRRSAGGTGRLVARRSHWPRLGLLHRPTTASTSTRPA